MIARPAWHRRLGQGLAVAGAVASGAPLAWIAYSALAIDHRMPLEAPLEAEEHSFERPETGRVVFYADVRGTGRPLLLVHSINAGASAYEMRPLFEHYRGQRPVYAVDLPGFGRSDRADRPYTAELYATTIGVMLEEQIRADEGIDVIALSLGSEFAAQAAITAAKRVHSLVLISPTGFATQAGENATQQRQRRGGSDQLYRIFRFGLWSQAFYDLLVSRPSIRYFLQRSFVGEVDAGLLDYDYRTTHQPGAKWAPLRFVSGKLFTPDARARFYGRVPAPVLVIYDRDSFVSFDGLPEFLTEHSGWTAERITPSQGLAHWEQTVATTAALDRWWAGQAEDADRG